MSAIRASLGLAASALAALAAIIARLDGDGSMVTFFGALTVLGAVVAWATHSPYGGWRRSLARAAALVWLAAAAWAAILIWIFHPLWSRGGQFPLEPEATYLGLTAAVYHVVGLYVGVILVLVAAFAPEPSDHRSARQRTET